MKDEGYSIGSLLSKNANYSERVLGIDRPALWVCSQIQNNMTVEINPLSYKTELKKG